MSTTLTTLIDRVHQAGGELVRVGPESIRLYAKPGAVSPDLREELRARKAELLTYLAPHPCEECGRFAFPTSGAQCYWCRRGRAP